MRPGAPDSRRGCGPGNAFRDRFENTRPATAADIPSQVRNDFVRPAVFIGYSRGCLERRAEAADVVIKRYFSPRFHLRASYRASSVHVLRSRTPHKSLRGSVLALHIHGRARGIN